LARLVAETDGPEEWKDHEAYCQYVSTTLAWLERGCCPTGEFDEDLACDGLESDLDLANEESCG
jgi:hypothetical protein